MAQPLRLLFVCDAGDETENLVSRLKNNGYDISHMRIETAAQMENALKEPAWDMVIPKYDMAGFGGRAALEFVKSKGLRVPVLLLTGAMDESSRKAVVDAGAIDLIDRNQTDRMMEAIEFELEKILHPDTTTDVHLKKPSTDQISKPGMDGMSARLATGFAGSILLILLLWGYSFWQYQTTGNTVMSIIILILAVIGAGIIFFSVHRVIIHAIQSLLYSGRKLISGHLETPVPFLAIRELDELAQILEFLRQQIQKSLENQKQESDARKHIENSLQQVHSRMTCQMQAISHRAHELSLLSKLSGTLLTCKEYDEAYDAIYFLMPKLLPSTVGGLYILNEAANSMDPVALWGNTVTGATAFDTDDCYALRKGQVYRVKNPDTELTCRHVKNFQPDSTSICIPMIAQGRIYGLLHIQEKQPPADIPAEMADDSFHLAVTAAEQLSLALANLKLKSALRHQSIRDALTGLFNRRYLDESLGKEIARAGRSGTPVGIIMIDIDHFKRFNDTHGHDAGDTVLQSVGKFISGHVREGDIACRYGGEEFTLIMPGATLESAHARAEELRKGVQSLQITHAGKPLESITLSLGVATFPHFGETGETVIQAADAALYQAKRNGRNRTEKASINSASS
ncbi:MAG: diguanylate cyclase [Desulfatirhabdiaceae bacterium]